MLNPSPNQKQKEAIAHPPAPLMILAGQAQGRLLHLNLELFI